MTAQTVSNAVAEREEQVGPIKFMWTKRSHLRTVLPRSVDVEAFLGTAAGALYANKTLMDYATTNPDSLMIALMQCAVLGHIPGTAEYYLTPRKDKGRGKVLGIEGYRGVIERMYRSGAVSKVVVREVCANDKFRYAEGVDDKPVHEFGGSGTTGADFFSAAGKRGEMVGGYAYAELMTGATSRVVILTRDDIHAARAAGGWKSAADEFSPWNRMDGGEGHPEFQGRSMWWKTLAKRLEPWVPTSAEYRRESLRASAAAVEHAGARRDLPELPASPPPSDSLVVDAEIVDDPTDASPAGTETTPGSAPSAAPSADVPPAGEAHRKPQQASSGQVGLIRKKFTELYPGEETDADRWERLGQTARLAGIDTELTSLGSTNDLTAEQAARVRLALDKVKTAAQLEALIASGEVPGAE